MTTPTLRKPPLTPEQEAYVRELIRRETSAMQRIVSAVRRAVLQLASVIKEDTTPSGS